MPFEPTWWDLTFLVSIIAMSILGSLAGRLIRRTMLYDETTVDTALVYLTGGQELFLAFVVGLVIVLLFFEGRNILFNQIMVIAVFAGYQSFSILTSLAPIFKKIIKNASKLE